VPVVQGRRHGKELVDVPIVEQVRTVEHHASRLAGQPRILRGMAPRCHGHTAEGGVHLLGPQRRRTSSLLLCGQLVTSSEQVRSSCARADLGRLRIERSVRATGIQIYLDAPLRTTVNSTQKGPELN